MESEEQRKIILFDGYCGLCNQSVDWVLAKDETHIFKFTPIQGVFLRSLALTGISVSNPSSILLLENETVYYKSTAALRIAKELPFPWKLLYAFIIIPRPIRDFVYDFIAKNRYKWFGKQTTCRIPTPSEAIYFLD